MRCGERQVRRRWGSRATYTLYMPPVQTVQSCLAHIDICSFFFCCCTQFSESECPKWEISHAGDYIFFFTLLRSVGYTSREICMCFLQVAACEINPYQSCAERRRSCEIITNSFFFFSAQKHKNPAKIGWFCCVCLRMMCRMSMYVKDVL